MTSDLWKRGYIQPPVAFPFYIIEEAERPICPFRAAIL
jgi:hypothetical protein